MNIAFRAALCLPFAALAACEDMNTATDPAARAELASQRSCMRAVEKHTGTKGASVNTTIPVVETQQYIIDLPNQSPWTCYTDETGAARELIETRL